MEKQGHAYGQGLDFSVFKLCTKRAALVRSIHYTA